jgi:molecular chaperone DnaJ
MQNFYELLEISQESTNEEITKAYKRQALKHHPDKSDSVENIFIQVREAYDTLIDPLKRKAYDEKLFNPKRKTLGDSLSEQLHASTHRKIIYSNN